jgi:hypothetical protein
MVGKRREDDDGGRRGCALQLTAYPEPVATGELIVDDDDVDRVGGGVRDRAFGINAHGDLEVGLAFEQLRQAEPNGGVVVDDQDTDLVRALG